ncbi:uncharacterized protein LOC143523316 isoform X2 [Brachyhypopomus gauderio]
MYNIVGFKDTDEVEVVPAAWVKDGICYWPPYKKEMILRAVKSQEQPQDSWIPYSIRVIYTASDYSAARRKLPEAVEHTDIQSEEEDQPRPKRRRRPTRKLYLNESADEDPGQRSIDLPIPPRIQPPLCRGLEETPANKTTEEYMWKQPSAGPYGQQNIHPSWKQTSNLEFNNLLDISCSQGARTWSNAPQRPSTSFQADNGFNNSSVPSWSQASLIERPHSFSAPSTSCTGSCRCESVHGPLLHELLTKQQIIIEQQKNIIRIIQHLNPESTTADIEEGLLPVQDLEALQSLERKLVSVPDIKSKIICTLGLAGGGDIRETVWAVMKRTFSNSVAKRINWRGVNGKMALQRLHLKSVLIDAVRRNPITAKATDMDVERCMKRWLQLAGDREGGRRARMRSSERTSERT